MFTVTEFNDLEELMDYRSTWHALWQRTPRAHFFQTREWLECYWRNLGSDRRFRILVVSLDQKPLGLLPLAIRSISTKLGRMRVLTLPHDGWATTFGPIGPNPTATLVNSLRYLAETPRDWDLIDLRGIEDPSLEGSRIAGSLERAGMSAMHRPWDRSAVIDLNRLNVGEQFLLRRRLPAAERSLWAAGSWQILECTPGGTGQRAQRQFWNLALPLFADRPVPEAALLGDVVSAAASREMLDARLLLVGNRAVGCQINVTASGQAECIAAAIAPTASDDVSTVLVGRMLSAGFDRGDRRFSFGPRVSSLAKGWPTEVRHQSRWTHFATFSPRAQLLRLAQWRHPAQRPIAPATSAF